VRRADVARLLTIAAAVDNRKLEGVQGEAAVLAWEQIVGDLELAECVAAMAEHRRTRPDVYLQPGHVRELVLGAREESAALESERRALRAFVAFTGASPIEAAERWGDAAWRAAQEDEARREHRARALEAGESA